jgi:hypothetical protein
LATRSAEACATRSSVAFPDRDAAPAFARAALTASSADAAVSGASVGVAVGVGDRVRGAASTAKANAAAAAITLEIYRGGRTLDRIVSAMV